MPTLETNVAIHGTSSGKAKAEVSSDLHLVGKATFDPTKAANALAREQLDIDVFVGSESAILQGDTRGMPPFAGPLERKKRRIF